MIVAQIRLSEELQKQLKDGSVSNEAKRLFQNFGEHQYNKIHFAKKKKSKKTTSRNSLSDNWVRYSENILKIARESAKKAYEYTVSLRTQKLIGRFELLDGLDSDIKTRRIFVPTNTMQLRDRIEEEHKVMLDKICKNSYTATDNIAKLLRTGQIGQFINEDEVSTAIDNFIILSLVKLDVENLNAFFADILAYKVRTLEDCKKIADKLEKYREIAIERLCARDNYATAKELASLCHKSNLIFLGKDNKKLDKIIKSENEYLERERIRQAEEERRKQEAAVRAAREAEERRIREEAERKRVAEERIRQEKIRLEAERKAKEEERRNETSILDINESEELDVDSTDTTLFVDEDKYVDNKNDDSQYYVKIYHLTDFKNIPSIRKNGIMSRTYVESNFDYIDIADSGALNNHRKSVINGVPLDNCARCFFNPMPPMYHKRLKEGFDNLSIIELHIPVKKVFKGDKITHKLEIDGSKFVKYYKQSIASYHGPLSDIESCNINEIRWDSSKAAYDNNRDDTIAKRSAELLIYPKIPSKYIYKVYTDRDLSTYVLDKAYKLGHPELIGDEYD